MSEIKGYQYDTNNYSFIDQTENTPKIWTNNYRGNIVKSIYQPKDTNNWNALHYAASWGNPEIINMLFDHVETLYPRIVQMLLEQTILSGETLMDIE